MKWRIAIWATVGALVVIAWTLYLSATFPTPTPPPAAAALLDFTCPIALLRHHPLNFYFVVFANAATYAGVGAVFEIIRHHLGTRANFN